MIYQHENKRTKILTLAASTQTIYATSLIMFALPIFMPRFIKIGPKLGYFGKKRKIFKCWGLCPQTPIP